MEFFTLDALAALLTLSALEIVLGFDNLVLIAILTERLPPEERPMARRLGLIFALVTRVMLLSLAFFMSNLTATLFALGDHPVSWRDIMLLGGGLFLIAKATLEIHHKIEDKEEAGNVKQFSKTALVIGQIAVMDIIFSFDSVMTAIGMSKDLWVMVTAIVIAMAAMVMAINVISDFISRHPTVKILALSYMILIGMALIAEAAHYEIPKGYLYFAMAFSFGVEIVNMLIRSAEAKRNGGEGNGAHPG